MASGVYKITNKLNEHCYVGSAVNITQRWFLHTSMLNRKIHHSVYLQRAWDKYGKEYFDFSILEECDKTDLITREQHYIDLINPIYNICKKARSALGVKHTKETRDKISKSLIGNTRTLGYKATDETRAKISASKMGNKYTLGHSPTEEHRRKISIANTGKKRSPESLIRYKDAAAKRKLIPVSAETRAKISASMKGKTSWLGRKHTEESKLKMSKSRKEREKRKNDENV